MTHPVGRAILCYNKLVVTLIFFNIIILSKYDAECPRSLAHFYIDSAYKIGQDLLDVQYAKTQLYAVLQIRVYWPDPALD